jgi:hypothetical protein
MRYENKKPPKVLKAVFYKRKKSILLGAEISAPKRVPSQ